MKIKLDTLEEVGFGLQFLHARARHFVRAHWRFGPASDVVGSAARPDTASGQRMGFIRGFAIEVGDPIMQIIKDTQKIPFTVSFVDSKGNPAAVENPQANVGDATVLGVTLDPQGDDASKVSGTVSALGPLGSTQLSVTVDSLVGDGEQQLVATADVQVVAGQAVVGNISFGEATDQ